MSFELEQSLVQHCRLLFETLCRSVKPFLLLLLRSLGIVPSLEYKTAALSLCRTLCQPQQLLPGRVEVQQHVSVAQALGCETSQGCASPSSVLFTA